MGQLLVRKVDDGLKRLLRDRADRNGVSMEEEIRTILQNAVLREEVPARNLADDILGLFGTVGVAGEPLKPLPRSQVRPANFYK